MDNKLILNEELGRIHELMYGVLSENIKFSEKIGLALAGLGDEFKNIKKIVADLKGLKSGEKIKKATEYKAKINTKINEIDVEKIRTEQLLSGGKITQAEYNTTIQKLDGDIAKLRKASDEIDNTVSEFRKASAEKRALGKQQTTNQQTTGTNATTIPPPPAPPISRTDKFKEWLSNPNVKKYAKYAALVGAGVAGVALLINWLKGSSNKNENCMGNNMDKHPNKIKIKISDKKKTAYWVVTPDNQSILAITPKLILEDRKGNLKAFNTSGQQIGSWKFSNDCTLYLVYGKQSIPVFTATGSAPSPSPKPPKRGGFKLCTGTYKFGCQSPKIGELQACLNIAADNKWGKNTEIAVKAKFGKNILTDAEIDQKCKAQPVTPPKPTPQPSNREELIPDIFSGEAPNNVGSSADMF